jgi:hypothetical protein
MQQILLLEIAAVEGSIGPEVHNNLVFLDGFYLQG